jgi:hypothetical protein
MLGVNSLPGLVLDGITLSRNNIIQIYNKVRVNYSVFFFNYQYSTYKECIEGSFGSKILTVNELRGRGSTASSSSFETIAVIEIGQLSGFFYVEYGFYLSPIAYIPLPFEYQLKAQQQKKSSSRQRLLPMPQQ